MFSIVLCDDNRQFLTVLKNLLERECRKIVPKNEDFVIAQSFSESKSLLTYIKDNHIDVIFLDIDMPHLNGFELAKILCKDYKQTKIVFMSAYDNFVYNAFEYFPFAYIRKDRIADEIPIVIQRIVDKLREPEKQINLYTTTGMKTVDIDSILYVESNKNYCNIHLIQDRVYTSRSSLSDFEELVKLFDFFRIHSAYLINMEHVDRVLENGFVSIHNKELPIAQRRIKEFKSAYADYFRRCFGT